MAKRLEELEQIKVIQWRDANKHLYPKLRRLFHVPNGGLRSSRTAITMSRLGTTKGVPDLILLCPSEPVVMNTLDNPDAGAIRKSYHFFAGEMKAPGGKPSKEQIEWKEMIIQDGGYWCCYEKATDMVRAIKSYLLIGA